MRIADNLLERGLNIEFFPRTKVALATSDSPVVMYDETRSPGLAHDTTQVFLPLDRSIILRFTARNAESHFVKHRVIDVFHEFNHLIGLTAKEEVYCPDPKALEEVGRRMGIATHTKVPDGFCVDGGH